MKRSSSRSRVILICFSAHALVAYVVAATSSVSIAVESGHNVLTYRQPAQKWESEALPIGNGRMGAMLFGGVDRERIQFNEQSLWSGDNNWDGAYDCGDHGFGAYRNFGDVLITWGNSAAPALDSPSGQAAGNGQPIANTVDGNPDTKWCIENPGKEVIWQASLPSAAIVKSYVLTSAADVPSRDPQSWVLQGSTDGSAWVELDRRDLGKPFEKRLQSKTFEVAHPQACAFYRLCFVPKDAGHFQVAEIALDGVSFASADAGPAPADYRRDLDIGNGVQTTSFTENGIHFTREAFASHPDQVMVFRYAADQPGAFSGHVILKSAQGGRTIANENRLVLAGEMPNKLKYAAILRVLHTGGSTHAQGEVFAFEKCDSLTFLLDARTNYKPDYKSGWRGADPEPVVETELKSAATMPYEKLRAAHIKDLSALLDRVRLDVGVTDPAIKALPTDERLKLYAAGGADPDLEVRMFQMGRYLLASCSRPGGLPANLQGLWNNSNNPAWACDYHNNINIQMNYWGAETANLCECELPLIDYVMAAEEPCRIASRKAFGNDKRGWTARTSQSIFGGNGWEWNMPASAWYAHHAYEHWAFTQDRDYLRQTAYPLIKEICEFWEDRLKRLPDGRLVVPNGWSPEHGPREDGVMMDQQIVWDLFANYLEAARVLNVDADYQAKVADMQAHLAPNKIGKWGQLQEWQADRDDPNDGHRHSSHLFAVYPGREISVTRTPELAAAARVSLMARSGDKSEKGGAPYNIESMPNDSRFSWVWPWRCALWARLQDGERAGLMMRGRLAMHSCSNLLCSYDRVTSSLGTRIIQLDGSFGITGAMVEMLMQSHAGEIDLLPAIPKVWAAAGSFTGLRARGGYTVDCNWKDGKVISYRIRADEPGTVKVRVNGEVKQVAAEAY